MKLLALTLITGLASSAYSQEFPIKLVQSTSAPFNTKPAEIFFIQDSGERSSSINAAILSDGISLSSLSIPGTVSSEFNFGLGISKSTLNSRPKDLRTGHLGVDAEWSIAKLYSLYSSLSYDEESDRVHGTRGHMVRFDLIMTGLCQRVFQDAVQRGASLKCYPYGGYYNRAVLRTDDAELVPSGRYGGPYGGLLLRLTLGQVGETGNWWAPLRFEANGYKLKDTTTKGGYIPMTFQFASITASYALYQSESSKWKPSISLSREVGTNRLINEGYVSVSKVLFQVSYGL